MLKSLFIASQERCDTTKERCTAWCESRESLQVYYFTVKKTKSTVFEAWRLKILRCIVGWRVGGTLICKTVLAFFWWSWKAERCVKVEISVDAYSKPCAQTNTLVYTDSLLSAVLLSHLYSVAVQLYSICLYALEELINTGQRLVRLSRRVLCGFVCAEAWTLEISLSGQSHDG